MSWKDPDGWSRMLSGEGCPMCADIHELENPHSYLVAELEHSYVRLPKNQDVLGRVLVALKRHANELFELDPQELAGFWLDVARAAKAVSTVFRPVKLYYGVFGGRCPHLHCHIIPMYADDDPKAPITMGLSERLMDKAWYEEKSAKLRHEIGMAADVPAH